MGLRCLVGKIFHQWPTNIPHQSAQNHRLYSVILGIESSCDDTGAAVVDSTKAVLGESLAGQGKLHNELGGIIPTIARDIHMKNIAAVVKSAMEQSNCTYQDLDAVAVAVEPGLTLSLLVGVNHAKNLAKNVMKPLIPIHHMQAHALTVRLTDEVVFPYPVLLMSGGHCLLCVVQDVHQYKIIGSGLDSAPGDVLDKVARRLKLKSNPDLSQLSGGAAVEMLARDGDPDSIEYPHVMTKTRDCNFSFGGIAGRTIRYIDDEEAKQGTAADGCISNAADLCASFQKAMLQHIGQRLYRAFLYCTSFDLLPSTGSLVLSGGVASNMFFRAGLEKVAAEFDYRLICPPPKLCCDNGIMIAWNGVEKFDRGIDVLQSFEHVEVKRRSPMGESLQKHVALSSIKLPRIRHLLQ